MLTEDGDHEATTRSERLIAGRYLLQDVLGRGGMGTVWRAHDQLLDRPVAAKELHILTDGDEEHRVRVRRAVREARAVARVPHPHVVGVHDLVESEDRLWIVMELVEGSSLAHRVSETGPLTPQQTAVVGLQLIDALDAVHAVGTLHRDVKPANVLLRGDGGAVLTDFGIAALDDGEFLTSTGQVVGSVEFMAPERVMGTEAGPASDLWSLGATLATVCGGQSPFRRPGAPATMHAVAYEEPALSERLGPLRPVVEALLRKSPDERPSAAAVRSALRGVMAGEPDAEPLHPATVLEFRPPAPSAVAETVTGSPKWSVPAGEYVPTARHTASLEPPHSQSQSQPHSQSQPQPRSSRPAGLKRLWWALAGTAVLAAGVAGGLFVTGTLPLKEGPKTRTASKVVQSTAGWQPVAGVTVQQGDRITVQFVSGEWTANSSALPMTGPAGYDAETDKLQRGAKACKVKATAPFAALLARLVGEGNFPVHVVGRRLTFRAAENASLQLGMNDAAGVCSQDDKGTLTVKVSVTHQG
ncbi:serine/threonine-protein kinase [Streptomyces sp. NPDC046915]|uniref:serine/threonine-protein kinase n=1 Tax=Streptomyces sp. NPDC046915 TaxID=3155257 RepID=UPI0033DCA3BA